MEKAFFKVSAADKTYHAMVQCAKLEPFSLQITLVNDTEVWRGEVFQEELQKQADATEKTFAEYWSTTKSALLCNDNGKSPETFCHDVKSTENSLQFSWKQELRHGIKFELGSIILHKSQQLDIGSFLDVAVNQFKQMKGEISSLCTDNEKLVKERVRMLKTLEECTAAKNGLEKDLFQKFTAVLNEKKAKIRELKKRCEDNLQLPSQRQKDGGTSVAEKDNLTDQDDTTDDEREVIRNSTAQSESHRGMPVIIDQISEDENQEVPSIKRKTRNKRQRATSSAIPRTRSLPRPSTKDSSSIKLSSSRRQTPCSTDPLTDPDKLMEEL